MTWDDASVALLMRSWGKGPSASDIAWDLRCTRNAVIGKANRLGLSCKPRAPRKPRKPKGGGTVAKVLCAKEFKPLPLPKELPADAIPHKQRKTLVKLEICHCRWPYGDPGTPEFFFCGAAEADITLGRPYCRFHTKMASGRTA
jgi:GcrA cell cycle regulator